MGDLWRRGGDDSDKGAMIATRGRTIDKGEMVATRRRIIDKGEITSTRGWPLPLPPWNQASCRRRQPFLPTQSSPVPSFPSFHSFFSPLPPPLPSLLHLQLS
jgi:hypothetical protein